MIRSSQISENTSVKSQILLANTSSSHKDYITKISTRCGGAYDASFTFTIDLSGHIYQHYVPIYYTNIFGIRDIDSRIISIGLENVGWVVNRENHDIFFDWKGSIYNGGVKDKLWRGYDKWADYTADQIDSMIILIREVSKEYHIKPNFSNTNVLMEDAKNFEGVLNRSNYFKYYYDLSPAALPYFDIISNKIKH